MCRRSRVHQAVVAALDAVMLLVARDQQDCVHVTIQPVRFVGNSLPNTQSGRYRGRPALSALVTGPAAAIVPLSASERQSGPPTDPATSDSRRKNRNVGLTTVTAEITPVVYTCGVSVLQELRRTKAVLGGL